VAWPKEGLVGVAVSDKILFTEKTCRNGAEEPALNFRSAPESDRLLRCRELTLWARSRQSAPQQFARLDAPSDVIRRTFDIDILNGLDAELRVLR